MIKKQEDIGHHRRYNCLAMPSEEPVSFWNSSSIELNACYRSKVMHFSQFLQLFIASDDVHRSTEQSNNASPVTSEENETKVTMTLYCTRI